VVAAGRRRRDEPAPPHAVFAALADPGRDPARRWLVLLPDELLPDAPLLGHRRRRVDRLVDADLRSSFGQ
jgi:hypothetical protein